MKKFIQVFLALLLALSLSLSLGLSAFADELPTEKVGYGYGCPDSAAVPMHGLLSESITIDGIDIELRCENGFVYICVTDLAAAKLLRESADKLAELGLDLSQLYITDGIILPKSDGLSADELAELQSKLSELTSSVMIKLSVGDTFALGNSGSAVLYVEIGGFALAPETEETAEAEETEPAAESKLKLDVQKGSVITPPSNSPAQVITPPSSRPEISTVYVSYGMYAEGGSLSHSDRDTYNCDNNNNEYTLTSRVAAPSYIYLVKSQSDVDNNTVYYYSKNSETYQELPDSFEDDKKVIEIFSTLTTADPPASGETHVDFNDFSNTINNTTVTIAVKNSDDTYETVKTIQYEDKTESLADVENNGEGYDKTFNSEGNATYYNRKLPFVLSSAEEGKNNEDASTVNATITRSVAKGAQLDE